MPRGVSSESTKRARASRVGREQGRTSRVNSMNRSANKTVEHTVISDDGGGEMYVGTL